MKNYQIQECPSAADGLPGSVTTTNLGYGFNQTYLLPSSAWTCPMAIVDAPAETVFMADTGISNASGSWSRFAANWSPQTGYPTLHGRHQQMANVLWMDGHAKAVKPLVRQPGSPNAPADPLRGAADIKNSIGDLLNPRFPVDAPPATCSSFRTPQASGASTADARACKYDYYYTLTKPQ